MSSDYILEAELADLQYNEAYTRSISSVLKTLRKRNGISQALAAEFLNINQGSYSRIESGITKISAIQFFKIAAFFDMEASALARLVETVAGSQKP